MLLAVVGLLGGVGLLGVGQPAGGQTAASGSGGDRYAMPAAYSWVGPDHPGDAYSIAVVRGITPTAALRAIGGVRKRLGRLTPQQAAIYVAQNSDPENFEFPAVVQVQQLGHSVVLYEPFGLRPVFRLAKLSANGIAAAFWTARRGPKEAKVARQGRIIRSFSVRHRPPRRNALPEERGLDWGSPGQNPFATGWAFNERLTLTHISQLWFDSAHPTFVVNGPAY